MEYCTLGKISELNLHVLMGINLEKIMLNEKKQVQKDKSNIHVNLKNHLVFMHMCVRGGGVKV